MDFIEKLKNDLEKLKQEKEKTKTFPDMKCTTPHSPQVLPDFCTPGTPISGLGTSKKQREVSLFALENKLKTKSPYTLPNLEKHISPEFLDTVSDKDRSCTLSYSEDIVKAIEPIKQKAYTCTDFLQNIEHKYANFIDAYYNVIINLICISKNKINFKKLREKIPVSESSVGKILRKIILDIISDVENDKIEVLPTDSNITARHSVIMLEIRNRKILTKNQMSGFVQSISGTENLTRNLENLIITELVYIPAKIHSYSYNILHDVKFLDILSDLQVLQDFLQKLDIVFDTLNIDKVKADVLERVKKIKMCGVTPEFPNIPSIPNITPNYSNLGLSAYSASDISGIPYWVQFSIGLNAIALNPKYWTVGLIVGTKRIKLPIVWIPLICIPTPACILVLWLTINGIVVFPVLYTLKFFPLGDSDSELTTLFKGGKQLIKTKTTSKSFNLPIFGGIDTNPKISSKTPYNIDDLPIQERLGLGNPPHVEFLNKWCSTAKPYMGL